MARARTLLLNTKVTVTGQDKLKGLGDTFRKAFSPQNLAVGGIALAGALTAGLAAATRALIDIERLNAQTAAVIKSTRGVANVTQQGIEDLAESAEDLTTIEREVVQEGANMLLTFTNVRNEIGEGNDIFDQATEKALDMSVALGTDLTSANLLLGKALNDPIRGMTAMTRAGIQFTDSQKDMIKALVASGDLLGAQKIILAELETQFGGSAEAFADTTAGRVARFQNDVGNMFESIIVGATKVADFLGQDVDLWPFDDVPDQIKDSMTQVNNAVAANLGGTIPQTIRSAAPVIQSAAEEALADPLITAMLGGQAEAERIASETPGGIAQALIDAQFEVEDASASLAQAMEDALHPMIERAQIIAFLSSQELADGLANGVPAVRARALELKEAAESRLAELQGAAFGYGLNAGTSFAAGLNAAYGYVRTAAGNLAAATRNQIGINSEPSDHSSPLYGITKWGENIAKTLAAGMLDELGSVRGAAGRLAGALVPSFGGSIAAPRVSSSGAGGGDTINFYLQWDGEPPKGRTESEIVSNLQRLLPLARGY